MVCFPFYVYKIRYEDIDEKLNIRLWAVTRDKKTISINVKNYHFYIYLELSDTEWKKDKVEILYENIRKNLKKSGHAPKKYEFDIKYKLYGAPEVCPKNIVYVLELYFDSLEAC